MPSSPPPPSPPPPPKNVTMNMYKHNQKKFKPETWIVVELSNYPHSLTRADVYLLFSGFHIAHFTLPSVKKFYLPLRTKIHIVGQKDAERAVKELNDTVMHGREIKLSILDQKDYENKEMVMGQVSDELKNGVIKSARVWHKQFADHILEVRELILKDTYYAFLQGRGPIPCHNPSEFHQAAHTSNTAGWQLIATRMSSFQDNHGRLEALSRLQSFFEEQGHAMEVWSAWEGSWA
ncbi:hypothetical protein B0J11DRAFT_427625 [Dendryphion nanum]|uniref:RRM domain-containing protein n=1 Tax=Dendryphion nanum TaxID=256645 RepID=A0A9P9E637_9PLEO|nr:hypothetical protein B0J11DRAFT_427625 [Dendryphion nanum]